MCGVKMIVEFFSAKISQKIDSQKLDTETDSEDVRRCLTIHMSMVNPLLTYG